MEFLLTKLHNFKFYGYVDDFKLEYVSKDDFAEKSAKHTPGALGHRGIDTSAPEFKFKINTEKYSPYMQLCSIQYNDIGKHMDNRKWRQVYKLELPFDTKQEGLIIKHYLQQFYNKYNSGKIEVHLFDDMKENGVYTIYINSQNRLFNYVVLYQHFINKNNDKYTMFDHINYPYEVDYMWQNYEQCQTQQILQHAVVRIK